MFRGSLALKLHEKAILLQKKIIDKDGSIQNYYTLAGIYHSLGMYNDEQEWLRKMLSIDPNNSVGYYGLGAISVMLGSETTNVTTRKMYDEEALNHFRKAIELNPDYVLPRIGEAMALFRNNKAQEAIDKIEEIKRMEMKGIFVDKDYYGLACLYVLLQDFDTALKHLSASFEKAQPSNQMHLINTAKHDPDLEPLRKLPECKSIIAKYG